tara:strand:+ start:203 stop:373 length:171 start_codon:yes stop_codon:yes gene_type:complete
MVASKCTELKQHLIGNEHFLRERRGRPEKYGHKKRLDLVRIEPKGQKLKISELICN